MALARTYTRGYNAFTRGLAREAEIFSPRDDAGILGWLRARQIVRLERESADQKRVLLHWGRSTAGLTDSLQIGGPVAELLCRVFDF